MTHISIVCFCVWDVENAIFIMLNVDWKKKKKKEEEIHSSVTLVTYRHIYVIGVNMRHIMIHEWEDEEKYESEGEIAREWDEEMKGKKKKKNEWKKNHKNIWEMAKRRANRRIFEILLNRICGSLKGIAAKYPVPINFTRSLSFYWIKLNVSLSLPKNKK